MKRDTTRWGRLEARYSDSRPRRMLALDGGGIRGVLTLAILQRLEQLLGKHYGTTEDFRLCHFFDYIGGTSTGAIIAAALARGLSATEVMSFYKDFGAQIFTRRRWGIWNSLYQDGPLALQLRKVYGTEATLEPEFMHTLLLVVMRNATTDSAWPLSSNPFALYNDPTRKDCNLRAPLWRVVRASTAAPVYFPAEVIDWEPGNPQTTFAFVDGGTTSYNNPAFLMARMATEPRYALGWERGERNLLVVSVGTGENPVLRAGSDDPDTNLVAAAQNTLLSLMTQAAYDQDVNCRTVGRCTYGDTVDREVGNLIPVDDAGNPIPIATDLGRSFLYARYNAPLSTEWLEANGLGFIQEDEVRALDAVAAIPKLEAVGNKAGELIDLAHLGDFVSEPTFVVQ
jgi:predicted acylesterase/phospholipase RssA